jgi:hypothetical protein
VRPCPAVLRPGRRGSGVGKVVGVLRSSEVLGWRWKFRRKGCARGEQPGGHGGDAVPQRGGEKRTRQGIDDEGDGLRL